MILLLLGGAVAFGVAFMGPLHVLLGFDIVVSVLSPQWEVSGVRVDLSDVVLTAAMLGWFLRGRTGSARIPYLGWWVLLGLISAVAYIHAPMNQGNFTSPAALTYQLIRYCFKPIAYYPLAILLLDNTDKVRSCLLTVVGTAIVAGLLAIDESISTGDLATGPFETHNVLGGALVAPLVLSLAGSLWPLKKPWQRYMCYAGVLIVARTLMLAGSRGAFVGSLAGVSCFVAALLLNPAGRAKVSRMGALGIVALLVGITVAPTILAKPSMQYLITAFHPTQQDNYEWRSEQRWPHFRQMLAEHPLLGVGTDRDLELGETANTPHNGYLSLALISGIPAAVVIVGFAAITVLRGARIFLRSTDVDRDIMILGIAAALSGVLVHNMVDATLLIPFVSKLFWIMIGVSVVLRRERLVAPVVRSEVAPRASRAAFA